MPWVKNGRFSGKKASKVERLRMIWSASTCPKSGLMVPTSDRSEVSWDLTSSPTSSDGSVSRRVPSGGCQ